MIPFNRPTVTGNEIKYLSTAIASSKISGDGEFSQRCHDWFERQLACDKALLTPNCTQALEMAAILLDVQAGDEIIMPSYTFVSTANAFTLRGAKIVFVDVRKDTMNIDERLIESAISPKTKAIVVVHYAGVSCAMDEIMSIAERNKLFVVEDAAQAMMSCYKGRPLGSIGHMGAYSFHETKNYTSGGEGGLLILNDPQFIERAEIIREKGTNRNQFFRGMVAKYSWVDIGSSYLPSELQAAYLWAQLESADEINQRRLQVWQRYYQALKEFSNKGLIVLPEIPIDCQHNAHMFYIKVANTSLRFELIQFLADGGICAVFHYIPLHSSVAGKRLGVFHGEDMNTTIESERLLRLPMFFNITDVEVDMVISKIREFFIVKAVECN
ncbi:dTDP-4-amino-4,6-dideoxygalactose transaminase [Agarivorans sp. Z349TD_8]|uniref:dTDP-4-amino-4,6-dideoxygalactose transaminase n=1 Tax=Agarivorans sp. Z349TD_8 TaxID=3421434 RepID=UPI003D7EC0F1